MDNLTHSLAGAALARAGLERATPLATATLVVAANAPDVDVASYLWGPYHALAWRRGLTHGLPAMAVLPFVVAAAMLLWDRAVRRRRHPDVEPARAGPILALSAAGLLTHPALDWMNTYGMRWLLPFDGSWTYGDALFIIDPWLWLLLGGAVVVGVRWRPAAAVGWAALAAAASVLVLLGPVGPGGRGGGGGGLVGLLALHLVVRSRERPGRATALGLLAVAVLYVGAMVTSDRAAREPVMHAARVVGLVAEEVMVAPRPGAPLAAELEVVTPTGYVPGDFAWLRTPRVRLRPDDEVPRVRHERRPGDPATDDILAAARARPDAARYLTWSRYPWARVTAADDGGWSVRFGDARYDDGGAAGSLSGVTVRVDPGALGR